MLRAFISPGLPPAEQHRLGRLDLYSTSLETFRNEAYGQLDRMLGPFGFQGGKRHPGHYREPLGTRLHLVGTCAGRSDPVPRRRAASRSDRIAIANTDAAGEDSTQLAIEQAYRAVHEVALL